MKGLKLAVAALIVASNIHGSSLLNKALDKYQAGLEKLQTPSATGERLKELGGQTKDLYTKTKESAQALIPQSTVDKAKDTLSGWKTTFDVWRGK